MRQKASSPDFFLWSVFDHKIDEDWPEVCTFGVACQDFVKHGTTSLCITIPELQLGELTNHIHTWEEVWQHKIKVCILTPTAQAKGWELAVHLSKIVQKQKYASHLWYYVFTVWAGRLTFFRGQTLQRPLQESTGSVTLTLLQQEGAVTQPHRFILTETLHHHLIQALCLLDLNRRQNR